MNNTLSVPEKADMSRPGFKGYQIEQNSSSKKFGKCPIQFVLEGGQEKPRSSIILNPNEQWCQSPAEALQCALTRITGTDDQDLAKDIIDRAISAMPMVNGKEHNTNVVYLSTSLYLIVSLKILWKQSFARNVPLYMLKECNIYPE
jgi:hypothetical protein